MALVPVSAVSAPVSLALSAILLAEAPLAPDHTAATFATSVSAVSRSEPAATPATAAPRECVVPCRSGFTCVDGSCLSACNPPCEAGLTCTSAGECIVEPPVAPAPPPPAYSPVAAPPVACQLDLDCRRPYTCVAGTCAITTEYLAKLDLQAHSRIVGGAITLGSGTVVSIVGAAFLLMIGARPDDPVDDDVYWLTGTTLLSVGIIVVAVGALSLGLGLKKRRRWRQYTGSSALLVEPAGAGIRF